MLDKISLQSVKDFFTPLFRSSREVKLALAALGLLGIAYTACRILLKDRVSSPPSSCPQEMVEILGGKEAIAKLPEVPIPSFFCKAGSLPVYRNIIRMVEQCGSLAPIMRGTAPGGEQFIVFNFIDKDHPTLLQQCIVYENVRNDNSGEREWKFDQIGFIRENNDPVPTSYRMPSNYISKEHNYLISSLVKGSSAVYKLIDALTLVKLSVESHLSNPQIHDFLEAIGRGNYEDGCTIFKNLPCVFDFRGSLRNSNEDRDTEVSRLCIESNRISVPPVCLGIDPERNLFLRMRIDDKQGEMPIFGLLYQKTDPLSGVEWYFDDKKLSSFCFDDGFLAGLFTDTDDRYRLL